VVAWGEDSFGEANVPSKLTNAVAIAAGEFYSLALKDDGTVVGWGYNGDGQTNVPPDLTNVVAIAAGAYHSLALKGDGTVVGWGYNGDGQTNVPPGLTNVVAVAGGLYHSLVLKGDGTVVAWGDNWDGETNVPPGLTNVVAIAAGIVHSLALGSLPPAIVTPPQSQSVLGESTAIFSVTATGTQPLGYQWYFNSGVLLTNATGATLTLTNVQPNQAGTYSVTVGNAYGNAAANATLAVQPFVFNAGSANMLMTTNGLRLQLDGVFASQSVVIFASTDLVAWLPILTNPPATGSLLFLDSSATNLPQRFYRASEQ
jgi:Regulator of chromosome condensation (RCC1) repeat/Immunoglobulin domain